VYYYCEPLKCVFIVVNARSFSAPSDAQSSLVLLSIQSKENEQGKARGGVDRQTAAQSHTTSQIAFLYMNNPTRSIVPEGREQCRESAKFQKPDGFTLRAGCMTEQGVPTAAH
jgi:hypothetical protein